MIPNRKTFLSLLSFIFAVTIKYKIFEETQLKIFIKTEETIISAVLLLLFSISLNLLHAVNTL